ncbi:MAG: hypothetical protein H6741_04915 [Alphaproteobacteria bacterium]|nr:hypothetical protein [Alphaproteobacteria bacterium]
MTLLLPLLAAAWAHGFPAVLVLYDTDEFGTSTDAFRQSVDDLGPHLEMAWVDETLWDGSNPPLRPYTAVIHLNGIEATKYMPAAGQQALVDFVADGGGYIHASWDAQEFDEGELQDLEPLILLTHGSAEEGTITLSVVEGQEDHPVLMDVTGGFQLTGGYDAGGVRAFATDPVTVLMQDEHGNPALVVREWGAGRVVGMHQAGNHGDYPMLEDPDLQRLYRNAIWWASRCDEDGDGQMVEVCGELDCDDGDPSVYYGADEVCDGVDNDCDDRIDGAEAVDAAFWYLDSDGDGHGTPLSVIGGCEAPEGYVAGDGDCDDNDPLRNPDAPERWYDAVDQDCDGGSDYDADGDGFDSASHGGDDCDDGDPQAAPGGVRDCADADPNDADGDGVSADEDCDDHHSGAHPGAEERWYDGVDQDCDGDDLDADGDGYDSADWGGEDCDDADPAAHPGAEDAPYDGLILDCVPEDEYDADGDGYDSADWGGEDCDDADPAISPGAEELWYDGVDQDCDGVDADRDGDGVLYPADCDDRDPAVGADPSCQDSGGGGDKDCGCGGGAAGGWLLTLWAALLTGRRRGG